MSTYKKLTALTLSALIAMTLGQSVAGAEEATRPPGIIQPAKPFASLPFHRGVADKLTISNGWHEAEDEQQILGEDFHEGIDFDGIRCGTPVLAVADGWAIASYQSGMLRGGDKFDPNDPGNPNTDWRDPISGQEGWLGFAGLFVELQTKVQVPGSQNAVAQYFHLAAFEPSITWMSPTRQSDTITKNGHVIENWYPASARQSQEVIRKIGKPVKKGDVIGWLGDTGINFGYNDKFDPNRHVVHPRDRQKLKPWDPVGAGVTTPIEYACQLHMEFYSARDEAANNLNRFDGMDLYERITGTPGTPSYKNPYMKCKGKFPVGPKSIFRSDRHGFAVYAQ